MHIKVCFEPLCTQPLEYGRKRFDQCEQVTDNRMKLTCYACIDCRWLVSRDDIVKGHNLHKNLKMLFCLSTKAHERRL